MGRGLALCSPIKNLATLCQSWDRPLKGQALSADALQIMKGHNPSNPLQCLGPASVLSRAQYCRTPADSRDPSLTHTHYDLAAPAPSIDIENHSQ